MNSPAMTRSNTESISDAAARWVARRDAGLSPAEQAEYEQWLARDPRHGSAVVHYARTWSVFDRPRAAGNAGAILGAVTVRVQQKRRRRQVLGAGFAALLVAMFAWSGVDRVEPSVATATPNAILLRPETRTLPDGSDAELKAGAEIEMGFDAAVRRVVLRRGEAHFKVVGDVARPFIVRAGGIEVRAVGTAFAVQFGDAHVEVLVTEGKVTVEKSHTTAHSPGNGEQSEIPTTVEAGQRLVLNLEPSADEASAAPGVQPVTVVEMNERLAWRSPRLEFSRTPLAEAVAHMNRLGASGLRLVIDSATVGLADEPVTGLFRADNAEAFVRVLELSLGVTADRRGENEIVLRKSR